VKTSRICTFSALCVLLVCLVAFQTNPLTPVSASLCQINNVAYDYPQQVQPSQQFTLTSTISASCSYTDPGIYYLALVVVYDASSGQQLTSNSAAIGYVSLQQPNVVATVPNLITSPSGNVAWQLRLVVYVINDYNQYFAPFQDTAITHDLTVNVGTVQQQQTVATTTTSSTTMTSSSTPQMVVTNTTTSAPATSLETNTQSSITSQSLTVIVLAIIVVLMIMVWKRRATSKQPDTSSKTETMKPKKE